ncbi:MAG: hypothetical protein GXP03_14615 [Alphaproteobacteria bacterium]|nr:hypothetical protein [Alphaproteobacteria bacterium]
MLFRGPRPDFTRPYAMFLGANETFGKFVPRPYPRLLQHKIEMPCANFAAMNAGVDLYLKDPSVLLATARARVTIVAVTGAHNMSNRFYSVHPRHNDRFVKPSKILQTLFRDVDFGDIHYTRHLLASLLEADAIKFSIVVEELKMAWIARMKTLLERIEGRILLLWMANDPPAEANLEPDLGDIGHDPAFVDQAMIDELSPLVTKVVECIASAQAKTAGIDGMLLQDDEAMIASKMPGPMFHEEAAAALEGHLSGML